MPEKQQLLERPRGRGKVLPCKATFPTRLSGAHPQDGSAEGRRALQRIPCADVGPCTPGRPKGGGSPLEVAHGALEGHGHLPSRSLFPGRAPLLPLAQRAQQLKVSTQNHAGYRKSQTLWEVSFLWLVQSFQEKQNITQVQTAVLELAWLTTA